MSSIKQSCSICGIEFDAQFKYQMEERVESSPHGGKQVRFVFYCSGSCLEASHHGGLEGLVSCDVCGTGFRVEYAFEVVNVGSQRRYVCTTDCRKQLVGQRDARGPAGVPAIPRSSSTAPTRPAPIQAGGKIIAIFNHKGGTGKTTTSVTIASGLAEAGKRVLLIDSDAQGNVAVSLGLSSHRSLYHLLVMGLDLKSLVQEARPGLSVLPSNETLAAAELYLAGRKQRDRVLASRLEGVRDIYDYVIVDCSPSLSLMNQNALVLADRVLCPVSCDYLSLVGVRQVLKTIKSVNTLLKHPLELWGVLPTHYDTRARICKDSYATLREHFGDRCLDPIRATMKVREAPACSKTLFEYAPSATATRDYRLVVDRIISADSKTSDIQGVA